MLYFDGFVGLVLLLLWVFCLVDVITTDDTQCRNLPKIWWVLIVLLVFDIGAVLWLVAGRPRRGTSGSRGTSAFPEYDRPGRFVATNPDDDATFLRMVRERAEEQRRQHRGKQRRDEAEDS